MSQKKGLNFYKLSHARMFLPKILFLVSLLFVALLISYLLNFLFFMFLVIVSVDLVAKCVFITVVLVVVTTCILF